jgi:hypothetical protein
MKWKLKSLRNTTRDLPKGQKVKSLTTSGPGEDGEELELGYSVDRKVIHYSTLKNSLAGGEEG